MEMEEDLLGENWAKRLNVAAILDLGEEDEHGLRQGQQSLDRHGEQLRKFLLRYDGLIVSHLFR